MTQKVQALRNDLASAEQRITEINGRRAYVIRAPTQGLVSTLQAALGQSIDPQRLQLEIIPQGAILQAELFVPARAFGFVEIGQSVRILYDAFPYQHFGTYRGRVTKISQTLLTSTDAAGPVALKEPAYRVTAALDRVDIEAYGKRIVLQPDMLLKAEIILERRSLARWLTSPLTSVRMSAEAIAPSTRFPTGVALCLLVSASLRGWQVESLPCHLRRQVLEGQRRTQILRLQKAPAKRGIMSWIPEVPGRDLKSRSDAGRS